MNHSNTVMRVFKYRLSGLQGYDIKFFCRVKKVILGFVGAIRELPVVLKKHGLFLAAVI